MGVQRQSWRLPHNISTLFLEALLCKCGRRASRFKVFSIHKAVEEKEKQVTRCLDCP